MLPETDAVRHLLAVRGCLTVRPTGTSMLPAIFPGDRVTLGPPRAIGVGDVVLIDGPRLHRVVAVDEARGLLVTRGDASASDDGPIGRDRVVAVMLALRPALRARLRFLLRWLLRRAAHTLRRRA